MGTPLPIACSLPRTACASPREEPEKPALRTRLAKAFIVLAVLYGMFSGERWMLEHSTAGANELMVATCVADAVFGDSGAADACTGGNTRSDKEPNDE